jgi:hypothetical protein
LLVKERRTRAFARQTVRASRAASPEASRAFDLIELDGEDFRLLPLCSAKPGWPGCSPACHQGLNSTSTPAPTGAEVFRQACKMGLEGIVSKRMTAPYRSGPSRDWIKVKRQPSDAAGARGAMVMAADLEQLLAPADLIPAGPLVPARRLISAMDLVPANPPLPACRLIPPLQLVPALLSGQRVTAAPHERTCSRPAGRGRTRARALNRCAIALTCGPGNQKRDRQ